MRRPELWVSASNTVYILYPDNSVEGMTSNGEWVLVASNHKWLRQMWFFYGFELVGIL